MKQGAVPLLPTAATMTRVAAVLTFFVVLLWLAFFDARPAYADTFTVNSTTDTDDGECDQFSLFTECTLREAINAANEASGQDTIAFNIPGPGVKTIEVGKFGNGQLPPIASRVTIDGYTQPGSSPNTNSQGAINASPLIELDGTNAGDFADGLVIINKAPNTVIRGLIINDFAGNGISSCIFGCTSTDSIKVEGNFIGTNAAGTATQANNIGVVLHSPNDTVGGTVPEVRNLISGNGLYGVGIVGPGSKVVGNLIGTSKNVTSALGNGSHGVVIGGDNNTLGGTTSGAANVIAYNDLDGVLVSSLGTNTGNRILRNSIHNNGELGIDLAGGIETSSGVTANDFKDPDTGANNLQNYPMLTSVTLNPDDTATVTGTLNSRPEKTYTIRFFSSAQADASGFGEGAGFLGQKKVTTNKKGNASFTFSPAAMVGVGAAITATATGGGGTSEFSHLVVAS